MRSCSLHIDYINIHCINIAFFLCASLIKLELTTGYHHITQQRLK